MQTLKEIADVIVTKKYLFQIVLPNKNFTHGKTTIAQATADNKSVQEYIESIIEKQNANNVLIKLFSVNGSSWKNRGEHLIFLSKNDTVATTATKIATPLQQNLNGLEQPIKTNTMNDKDYIDFKVLQIEQKRLEQYTEECKCKIIKLEKKVDELHDENKKLLRDNTTKEDKHKIALERERLNLDKEAKGGLSGLMGELNENPEILKMIAGFIKPDHPMFKENGVGAVPQIEEIRYHTDDDANNVLKEIPKQFKNVDAALVIRFFTLAHKFASEPLKIEEAFKYFYPGV